MENEKAIMPLSDYKDACDKIREKVGSKIIVDNKAFYSTENNFTEILTVGTLKVGENYSVKYTDHTMSNYNESGVYEVKNITVQGKDTIGLEVNDLPHPIGDDVTNTIYVYQDGENIMLYVLETYIYNYEEEEERIYITLEKITGKIVSGEMPEKINEVYEAGQAQGEREMWDNLTNYNTLAFYETKFSFWGGEHIRPPYKLTPTAKRSLYCTFNKAEKLKKVEADYFDFSQKERGTTSQEGLYYTFYNCSKLEEIEDIGIQADYTYNYAYANCVKLKRIAVVRSDENTKFSNAFDYCYELEDITFEGVIGQNGLNLRWSVNLSKASWQSIIGCLSTTTSGLSITGSLASIKKAFETSPGANDGDTSTEWLELETSRSNWKINLL